MMSKFLNAKGVSPQNPVNPYKMAKESESIFKAYF